MNIIWAGSEDTDFPTNTPAADTTVSRFRTGYTRCALNNQAKATTACSRQFDAGAITAGWVSCRYYVIAHNSTARRIAGIGDLTSGTKGLFFGMAAGSSTWGIYSFDGSTESELATGGTVNLGVLTKIDIKIVNYGASGEIYLYIAGGSTESVSYSGDISISGVSGFDCYMIGPKDNWEQPLCEFIVADDDTRLASAVTGYPIAAGDTNDFTGAYTDIDEVEVSDADSIYTNTASLTFQCSVSDMPSGAFRILGVNLCTRAFKSADASITSMAQGIKSGSTSSVTNAVSLTTAGDSYQYLMGVNPVTGVSFSVSEINSLQIQISSAA